jgi:hypothetical protein
MGQIIGGATQMVGSMIGGGKRRREERAAMVQANADNQAIRDYQFSNPYANLENVAEDLTINQQASQFQAQQTDAALAQGLDAIVAGGGGGGGAQAIAQAALQSKQNISANIAGQESQNQMARVNQAGRLQQLQAQGEEDLQSQQYKRLEENQNMSSQRFAAAQAARAKATSDLVGGIGDVVGGVATGGLGDIAGMFTK